MTRFRTCWVLLALLTLAFFALDQSREILRAYLFDRTFSAGHLVWVVVAFVFASLVFARSATSVVSRFNAEFPADPLSPRWIVLFSVVPLVILGAALACAFAQTLSIGLLRNGSIAGLLLGAATVTCALVATFGPFGDQSARFISQRVALPWLQQTLDVFALLMLAWFLLLPLASADRFVGSSQTMGPMPIVLLSFALLAYCVHRFRTTDWSEPARKRMLFILLAAGLAVIAGGVKTRAVGEILAGLVMAGFALIELQLKNATPATVSRASMAALCGFGVVIAFGDIRPTTQIRTEARKSEPPLPTFDTQFEAWLNARKDIPAFEGKPYPIYLAAAEGGGLYAAHHAAMALADLQDRCPRFRHHLFAVSGVSGGSVGASVFAHLARDDGAESELNDCVPLVRTPAAHERITIAVDPPDDVCAPAHRARSRSVNPNSMPLMAMSYRKRTCEFLARDFLSPVFFLSVIPNIVARTLAWIAPVLPPRVYGAYDRALGLELGLEVAARETARRPGATLFDTFMTTGKSWTPEGSQPALFLNTSRVDTGERYIAAPFRLDARIDKRLGGLELHGFDARVRVFGVENPEIDLRLSTAAVLSARFPFVTPPGTLNVIAPRWLGEPHDSRFDRAGFVDGGYVDNSGLRTAVQIGLAARRVLGKRTRAGGYEVSVIMIGGSILGTSYWRDYKFGRITEQALPGVTPDVAPATSSASSLGEFSAPYAAVLAARSRRAHEAAFDAVTLGYELRQIGSATNLSPVGPMHSMTMTRNPLPLGWVLSDHTRRRIEARLVSGETRPWLDINVGTNAGVPVLNKSAAAATKALGEDLALWPDNSLVDSGVTDVTRALSPGRPVPPKQ